MVITIPIPSIDFLVGKPCRLFRGNPKQATFYDVDPLKRAQDFEKLGAQIFHLVNLDGALGNQAAASNQKEIKRVVNGLRIPVQVGGGIRSGNDILAAVRLGIDRIILGTSALNPDSDTKFYLKTNSLGSRLIADIGFAGDRVLVKGWQNDTGLTVPEAIAKIVDLGFKTLVLTNKNCDGAQVGPDLSIIKKVAMWYPELELVISGGISTKEHLKVIRTLDLPNVQGFIIGKRLWAEDGLDFFSRAVNMFI